MNNDFAEKSRIYKHWNLVKLLTWRRKQHILFLRCALLLLDAINLNSGEMRRVLTFLWMRLVRLGTT